MMQLDIIVVNYNTAHLLDDMFSALRGAARNITYSCVVVDNASRDNSVSVIKRDYSDCRLIENRVNVGFGRANNQGLPFNEASYVLLLNTDAFVASDTLERTLAYMDTHPQCGILGVKLVGRDGALQPSARYFPTVWGLFLWRTGLQRWFPVVRMMDDMNWDHASVRDCDWVPGCYMLIRKEVIDQVGLFDPRFFLYYEEVDFCLAAKKAGWEVTYFPDTSVVHLGGESAKSDSEVTASGSQIEALQVESELLYFRKNHGALAALTHVLLTSLADAIIVAKRLLKGSKPVGFANAWRHSTLVWSLFRQTCWGIRPTR